MDAPLADLPREPSGSTREGSGSGLLLRALRLAGTVLVSQARILSWLPPLAWASLIFFLSSGQPSLGGLDLGAFGGFFTNLAHPGAFGALALLLIPVFGRTVGPHGLRWTKLTPTNGLWVVTLVALYGLTDEIHQSTVDGRDASLLDWLSDMVGAYFVVRVALYLGRVDATARGLRRWLLAGLLASVASAALATWYTSKAGSGPWPF
jgi:VanZ family protein